MGIETIIWWVRHTMVLAVSVVNIADDLLFAFRTLYGTAIGQWILRMYLDLYTVPTFFYFLPLVSYFECFLRGIVY